MRLIARVLVKDFTLFLKPRPTSCGVVSKTAQVVVHQGFNNEVVQPDA
jgi:hypothetical protein